jgi:regulatory protein
MRITGLRQTSPERFTVELSDGGEIKTTLNVVTDRFLHTGMDIDDAELDELRAASVYSLCLAHAMRLIGSQALSKKGLTDKLRQKGEDAENAQKAVDYLEQMGLLDDAAYAGIVVRHYAAKGLGGRQDKKRAFPPRRTQGPLGRRAEGNARAGRQNG